MTAKEERRRNKVDATGRYVAANLRRLREARRLSTADLSRELETRGRPIPATGITRIEKGQRTVDVDDLLTFADVLRVPPTALLFPLEDDPDSLVEITSVGAVPAWKAWRWADGAEPVKHPFDEDEYADLQLNGRPKFRRRYARVEDRTPDDAAKQRAVIDQVYNEAQYPDAAEREAARSRALRAAKLDED